MTILHLKNWLDDEKLDGLLFFAQIIEEMVSRFTIDSYKAPVLNSHSLCDEIIDVIEEINQGFLHEKAVESIKEELLWNLQNDPVAKIILGYRYNGIYDEIKNAENPKKLKAIITPIKNLFERNYLEVIKVEITKKIRYPKQKEKILNLSRLLISELTFYGYSQEYLHNMVMQSFFSTQRIESLDHIEIFLNNFCFQEAPFDVFIKADEQFILIKELESLFDLEIKEEPDELRRGREEEKDFFKYDENYPIYIKFSNIQALDPFNAHEICKIRLQHIKSLGALSNHKVKINWEEKALVYSKTDFITVIDDFSSMLKVKDSDLSNMKSNIDEIISIIVNLDVQSKYFIYNSLNLHLSAIESKNVENQLMNLWTALETLLPPPIQNDIRITHFLNSYESFLGRKYIQKLIIDLMSELRYELNDNLYNVLSKMSGDLTEFEKIASLIAIKKDNEPLRDEIYKKIGKNLRLRHKIFVLMNNLHKSDRIYELIKLHNKRIKWQLQRIYRARNLIVHKGGQLIYVNQLVENLHSYYHSIILLIKEIQTDFDTIESLETIFKLVKLEHEAHMELLKKSESEDCTIENFRMLLFCNPR